MRRLRMLFALSGALIAAALVAPPAGAFQVTLDTGNTPEYTVNDATGMPGVICRYESNPGTQNDVLNRIRIRQVHAHGPFPQKSWVGFRFVIKRNAPPFDDGVFRTVFRSPIRKARANDTEVAFFRGGWNAPETGLGQYRVHLYFYWYRKGSQTQVIGRVRGLLEVHRLAMQGAASKEIGSEGAGRFCVRNFHDV